MRCTWQRAPCIRTCSRKSGWISATLKLYTKLPCLWRNAQTMTNKYPRRNLVTGGAGFIGSHYLNYAVKKYPRELFINVDALTYAADLRNVTVQKKKNYAFEKADICDMPAMTQIFDTYKPTHVIPFAAETHVDHSIITPGLCVKTNVEGTNNLLQLARAYKLSRFHLISTDEAYGDLGTEDEQFTEDSPYT